MGIKELEEKIDAITPIIQQITPFIAAVSPEVAAILTVANQIKGDTTEIKENQGGGVAGKSLRNYQVLQAKNQTRLFVMQSEHQRLLRYRGIIDGVAAWSEEETEGEPGANYQQITVKYLGEGQDEGIKIIEASSGGSVPVELVEEIDETIGEINTVDYRYSATIKITTKLINNLSAVAKYINYYTPMTVKERGDEKNAEIGAMYGYKSLQAPINDYWLTESLRFLVPMWFSGIQSH